MRTIWLWSSRTVLLFAFAFPAISQEISPEFFTVELSASASVSPPALALQWLGDTNATNYAISRKTVTATNWILITNLPGSSVQFTDRNVSVGSAYEYQIIKGSSSPYVGSGYLYGGIEAAPIEQRGSVILLIDSTWKTELAGELKRLEQDLIGDGWSVINRYVAPTTPVPDVKALIQSIYSADPAEVKALFLFGHIPVPYSGNYAADSHENHTGAWPADTYYADVDGVWTDSTVNNANAEKEWNHNVPGDGKFDQSQIPSDVELEVGRVDLSNLTCFSNKTPARDELALLRQYLNKDHAFRHAGLALPRRGLICYNFEDDTEALRSTPMRIYAPLFGPAGPTVTVPWGSYFPTLKTNGFLFAYGAGGGSYYTCAGVGSSDDFALTDIKAVFTLFFGSYFGDWDNESNFLRASLGSSSYTLTASWAGRPHWFMHPMALGQTIGFSTKLTQNNRTNGLYRPRNIGTRAVHVALLGDPTLRLHPVVPATNLVVTASAPGFSLSWNGSRDENIRGYYVYRAPAESGPFTRISGSEPLQAVVFHDPDGAASSVYMVRAVKLETSGSGTYYNLSQGIFARPYPLPAAPSKLDGSATPSRITVTWQDNATNESGFYLYRHAQPSDTLVRIATLSSNVTSFQDTNVVSGNSYLYSVSAYNQAGEAFATDEATIVVPSSSAATFVGVDRNTAGSWKGSYGAQGYNILQDSFSYPSYVNVLATGPNNWVWNWDTTDLAALQRAGDSTRLAACWYAFSPFEIRFSFLDTATHRVSLYCLDWDMAGRAQKLDFLDSNSGVILLSQTISNFQNGVYITSDLRGNITARLTPASGNAVLSGIFFDSPLPTAAAPVMSPLGGKYTNSVEVTMTSSTSGSEIRYTLDGSVPTASSLLYSSPLTLTNTVTVTARTFKSGMNPSTAAMEKYTIVRPTGPPAATVTFNGINTSKRGSWKGFVGSQGYSIFSDSQLLPSYVTVNASGKSDWIWEYATDDLRALQRQTDSSRMAACWYSSDAFEVAFNFMDQNSHRLSLYCLDWDFGGREETIEIVDAATGQVLHSYELANFSNGIYLSYTIKGPVIARFTRIKSYNAVLSGFFLDAP